MTLSQPLVQQGLGAGLAADSALQDVDVILSGPLPLLESLSQDDLFVILDLNGLIAGTHTVTPKVVLPDGITLEGVIPETVEVVIKARDGSEQPGLPALPATNTSVLTPTVQPAGETVPLPTALPGE